METTDNRTTEKYEAMERQLRNVAYLIEELPSHATTPASRMLVCRLVDAELAAVVALFLKESGYVRELPPVVAVEGAYPLRLIEWYRKYKTLYRKFLLNVYMESFVLPDGADPADAGAWETLPSDDRILSLLRLFREILQVVNLPSKERKRWYDLVLEERARKQDTGELPGNKTDSTDAAIDGGCRIVGAVQAETARPGRLQVLNPALLGDRQAIEKLGAVMRDTIDGRVGNARGASSGRYNWGQVRQAMIALGYIEKESSIADFGRAVEYLLGGRRTADSVAASCKRFNYRPVTNADRNSIAAIVVLLQPVGAFMK